MGHKSDPLWVKTHKAGGIHSKLMGPEFFFFFYYY